MTFGMAVTMIKFYERTVPTTSKERLIMLLGNKKNVSMCIPGNYPPQLYTTTDSFYTIRLNLNPRNRDSTFTQSTARHGTKPSQNQQRLWRYQPAFPS